MEQKEIEIRIAERKECIDSIDKSLMGKETVEQVYERITLEQLGNGYGTRMDIVYESMRQYALQYQSVSVSEEERNIYREQGWDGCNKLHEAIGHTLPPEFTTSFLSKKPYLNLKKTMNNYTNRKEGWYSVIFNIANSGDWSICYYDGKYWYGVNNDGCLYDSDFSQINETPINPIPLTQQGEDIRKEAEKLYPLVSTEESPLGIANEWLLTCRDAYIKGYAKYISIHEGKIDKGWVALFKDESEYVKYLTWRREPTAENKEEIVKTKITMTECNNRKIAEQAIRSCYNEYYTSGTPVVDIPEKFAEQIRSEPNNTLLALSLQYLCTDAQKKELANDLLSRTYSDVVDYEKEAVLVFPDYKFGADGNKESGNANYNRKQKLRREGFIRARQMSSPCDQKENK